MVNVDQLVGLGYSVELATAAYADGDLVVPATYRIEGYGAIAYVRGDDLDRIGALLDPELHAERVDAFENPPVAAAPGPSTAQLVGAALEQLPEGPLSKADLAGVIAALAGG